MHEEVLDMLLEYKHKAEAYDILVKKGKLTMAGLATLLNKPVVIEKTHGRERLYCLNSVPTAIYLSDGSLHWTTGRVGGIRELPRELVYYRGEPKKSLTLPLDIDSIVV